MTSVLGQTMMRNVSKRFHVDLHFADWRAVLDEDDGNDMPSFPLIDILPGLLT